MAMGHFHTPLKKARGAAPAHHGTGHFIAQRMTALANLFFTAFLVLLAIRLAGADQAEARAVIAQPFIAIGLITGLATFVWHMALGMQVIIEDYVHTFWRKALLLSLNILLSGLLLLLAVASIAMIAFGS